mmetsp:Transcript_4598/g.16172  ORF Transcript_4598/g.16172 Transcript_4598/m.16172 type:complete len:256 (-) Transcript_4598:886-1653(-)
MPSLPCARLEGLQVRQGEAVGAMFAGLPLRQEVHGNALLRAAPVQEKVLHRRAVPALPREVRQEAGLPQSQVRSHLPPRQVLPLPRRRRGAVLLRQGGAGGAMWHGAVHDAAALLCELHHSAHLPPRRAHTAPLPLRRLPTVPPGVRSPAADLWTSLPRPLPRPTAATSATDEEEAQEEILSSASGPRGCGVQRLSSGGRETVLGIARELSPPLQQRETLQLSEEMWQLAILRKPFLPSPLPPCRHSPGLSSALC